MSHHDTDQDKVATEDKWMNEYYVSGCNCKFDSYFFYAVILEHWASHRIKITQGYYSTQASTVFMAYCMLELGSF